MTRFASLLTLAACAPAHAQFGLPPLPAPTLPGIERPFDADEVMRRADRRAEMALDVPSKALRQIKMRDFRRAHGRGIDVDPLGELVVRGEVIALSPSTAVLDQARAAGFVIRRQRALGQLGIQVVVLGAPPGDSTRRAVERLRTLDPHGAFDFNHIYMDAGDAGAPPADSTGSAPPAAAPAAEASAPDGHAPARDRLGLIDGGVDTAAALLHDAKVTTSGCAGKALPSAHGTAVASLLVGQGHGFRSAAAGLDLYAANVYCGDAGDGSVDRIADAFAWLDAQRVPVLNVSLVGPPNRLLAELVRVSVARGRIVVAAVGNDGPAAPPLYPAAYPGVIAVTAVDARRRALPEAGQGPQVQFAAPGSDMVAASGAGYTPVRGTSFAAPIVAGLLAARLVAQPTVDAGQAVAALVAVAVDLGATGRDPVFGAGLVGESFRNDADGLQRLERIR
jgi:hypothetical protein